MGGPGSGQRPSKYSTRDCRVVSVGELLAAARRHPPGGEVLWRARADGQILGRLSYRVSEEHWPEGTLLRVLALRYQPAPQAAESRERLMLDAGQPALAHCPACERPLRKLYAPPGAPHFLCRCCHSLVYRSPPRHDDLARAAGRHGGPAARSVRRRGAPCRARQPQAARPGHTHQYSQAGTSLRRSGAADLVSAPEQGRTFAARHRPSLRGLQKQRGALPGGRA